MSVLLELLSTDLAWKTLTHLTVYLSALISCSCRLLEVSGFPQSFPHASILTRAVAEPWVETTQNQKFCSNREKMAGNRWVGDVV